MAVSSSVDPSAVREFVDPDLRHSAQDVADLGATADLYEVLRGLTGPHRSFAPPSLGVETSWIDEQLTASGPEWRTSWKEQGVPARSTGDRVRSLVRRAIPFGR